MADESMDRDATPSTPSARQVGGNHKKILIAKTSLDGHWRGVSSVSIALRDAGFEVIVGGMLRPLQVAAVARDEDVDLVGLNIGGRIEVAERAIDALAAVGLADVPVFVGGTVAPYAAKRLAARGVAVFPPGSRLDAIVASARRLTGLDPATVVVGEPPGDAG